MSLAPQLAWEDLERELRKEDPPAWFERMKKLDTNRFNQHKLLLDRFATGTELKALFRMACRHRNGHPGYGPWMEQAMHFSPSYRDNTARYRRRIHPGRHHEILRFQLRRPPNTTPRPLVIGFTGNKGLLMAPTPYILSALGTMGMDLLLVRRRTLEGYFHHQGEVLEDILAHLNHRIGRLGHSDMPHTQVQSLGTSAGGLAALVVAQRLQLRQGVAIGAGGGPETFRPGSPVSRALSGMWNWWPRRRRTSLVLAYPENNEADRISAGCIARYYAQNQTRQTIISRKVYRGCENHTLFADLLKQGVNLESALSSLLCGIPSSIEAWTDSREPLL